MRELVRSLRGDHTIVISSHILSEISETCDRILLMTAGCVNESGTEAELVAKWLGLGGDAFDAVVIQSAMPPAVFCVIVAVQYDLYANLEEMFAKFQAGNPGYDVIVPTNDYVERMIIAEMLEEIEQGYR